MAALAHVAQTSDVDHGVRVLVPLAPNEVHGRLAAQAREQHPVAERAGPWRSPRASARPVPANPGDPQIRAVGRPAELLVVASRWPSFHSHSTERFPPGCPAYLKLFDTPAGAPGSGLDPEQQAQAVVLIKRAVKTGKPLDGAELRRLFGQEGPPTP